MTQSSDQPPNRPVGLPPPQFRLRTLFLWVTVSGFALALLQWIPFLVWVGLLFLGVTVALHVAGNAFGNQLRRNHGGRTERTPADKTLTSPIPAEIIPAPQLGKHTSVARSIHLLTFVGGMTAAFGSLYWARYQYGGKVGWESFAVSFVAFGVLGAIWTFLAVSFLHITFGAAWHAIRHHSQEESDRNVRLRKSIASDAND